MVSDTVSYCDSGKGCRASTQRHTHTFSTVVSGAGQCKQGTALKVIITLCLDEALHKHFCQLKAQGTDLNSGLPSRTEILYWVLFSLTRIHCTIYVLFRPGIIPTLTRGNKRRGTRSRAGNRNTWHHVEGKPVKLHHMLQIGWGRNLTKKVAIFGSSPLVWVIFTLHLT